MSRLIKAPDASVAQPFDWAPLGALDEQGVHEFRPRQLDVVGSPVVEQALASEPEPPPEPAPAPTIDLDEVSKEAFQHGFSEGVESGRQDAEQSSRDELQTSLVALGGVATELASYKDALRHDVERELVELAFSIARRIIRRELTVDPSATVGIIRSCFEEFAAAEIRRVEVHPADAGLISAYLENQPGPVIDIVPNESIQRGGAIFDTAQGQVDARLEAQISEIENGLADRWTPAGSKA